MRKLAPAFFAWMAGQSEGGCDPEIRTCAMSYLLRCRPISLKSRLAEKLRNPAFSISSFDFFLSTASSFLKRSDNSAMSSSTLSWTGCTCTPLSAVSLPVGLQLLEETLVEGVVVSVMLARDMDRGVAGRVLVCPLVGSSPVGKSETDDKLRQRVKDLEFRFGVLRE